MGVFVIIGSLPFAHSWGFNRIFINLWRQHLHVGSQRAYPLPQSRFNSAPYICICYAPLSFSRQHHLHVGSRRAYPLPQSRFSDATLKFNFGFINSPTLTYTTFTLIFFRVNLPLELERVS